MERGIGRSGVLPPFNAEREGFLATDGHGRMRVFIILALLYSGQAIPVYLVVMASLPIMREQGIRPAVIGLVGLLLVPTLLRFLWAPYVDRFRPVASAHRASWIAITQVCIMGLLVAMSFVPPWQTVQFLAISMGLAALLATSDIAVDGYAARSLAPDDRPLGNAIQGSGVSIGIIIGGSGGLLAYRYSDWQTAVLLVTAISCLPLIATVLMIGTEAEDNTDTVPVRPDLRDFFRRGDAVAMFCVALVFRASEGLANAMTSPYLVDSGVALETIGKLNGVAAATAGLGGAALCAALLRRYGCTATLGLLGALRTVCYLWLALHAFGLATGHAFLLGVVGFETLVRSMEIVATYTLFMAVTSRSQPGTDFSILHCTQIFVYMAGTLCAGLIADRLGYYPLFATATVVSLVSLLWSVRLLRKLDQTARR